MRVAGRFWNSLGVLCLLLALAPARARADSLAGDTVTAWLACYDNPACEMNPLPQYPLLQKIGSFVAGSASSSITFASSYVLSSNFTAGISGSVAVSASDPSQLVLNLQGTSTLRGGFLGYELQAFSPSGDPLLISGFALLPSGSDFTLADISLLDPSGLTSAFNFQGIVNGYVELDVDPIQGAPEDSTLLLVASGLLLVLAAVLADAGRRRYSGPHARPHAAFSLAAGLPGVGRARLGQAREPPLHHPQ